MNNLQPANTKNCENKKKLNVDCFKELYRSCDSAKKSVERLSAALKKSE